MPLLDETVVLFHVYGEGERGTKERAAVEIAGEMRGKQRENMEKEMKGLGAGKTCMRDDVGDMHERGCGVGSLGRRDCPQ
jgi:hypothetical protein